MNTSLNQEIKVCTASRNNIGYSSVEIIFLNLINLFIDLPFIFTVFLISELNK